jgi:L-asparaginase II
MARSTFAAVDAVELAVVERSGFVESRHVGAAVVLGPDGKVVRELGDVRGPIFPRSALKPFQALAALASGAKLTPQQTVLATASHVGSVEHAKIVRSTLRDAGLKLSALGCPADWPEDSEARDQLIRDGHGRLPIFHNCSGKHAAMLAACVAAGEDPRTYLQQEHPLQVRVKEVVQRMTGEHVSISGIDGCGAPVHAVSLAGLAAGFARIRTTKHDSPWPLYRDAAALTDAVLAAPWLISGRGHPDAVLIEELGALAKRGAEGVLAVALEDGTTVAVKVLDGSSRPAAAVAVDLLASVGAIDGPAAARVRARLDYRVLGGTAPVGALRVTCV